MMGHVACSALQKVVKNSCGALRQRCITYQMQRDWPGGRFPCHLGNQIHSPWEDIKSIKAVNEK